MHEQIKCCLLISLLLNEIARHCMSVVCFCVTTWESCLQLDEPMQSKTVASALANLEKKKKLAEL